MVIVKHLIGIIVEKKKKQGYWERYAEANGFYNFLKKFWKLEAGN